MAAGDSGVEPEAFVTVGDRVAATGTSAELGERFPGAERVDLGDAVVVPGFHDAHMHPSMTAEDLLHVDLSAERVRSPDQLRAALGERAARVPAGGWVRASRYDHVKTTGGVPIDRHGLDRAAGGHPALVVQVAGHWAVASSAALAAAGIDDDTVPPPGGSYGRDAAGHLNGIVYERAMDRVFAAMPATSLAERLRGLAMALEMFHAAGLTSVGDTLVDGGWRGSRRSSTAPSPAGPAYRRSRSRAATTTGCRRPRPRSCTRWCWTSTAPAAGSACTPTATARSRCCWTPSRLRSARRRGATRTTASSTAR